MVTGFMAGVGRSLVILDGADTIDDADNASYIDLEYFLPDAPSVDVIITTRSSRAQEIQCWRRWRWPTLNQPRRRSLFRINAKLDQTGSEAEEGILLIVKELGYLALAVTLAGVVYRRHTTFTIRSQSISTRIP